MTKKEAVSIITNCAARYAANLCNRQLAFVIPKPPGKIFAIFRGSVGQENYDALTFRSGSLDITKKCLPPSLLEKTDPALFIPETESPQI